MGVRALSLNSYLYLGIIGLLAWLIGFFLGRIFGSANASELLKERERRLRLREQEFSRLQAELGGTKTSLQHLEAERAMLTATLKTRENWIGELETKQQAVQADLEARISELDELKAETELEIAVLQTQLQTLQTTAQTEAEAWKIRVAEAEGALKFTAHTERELRVHLKSKDTELSQLKVRVTELEMMMREVKDPPARLSAAATLTPRNTEPDDLKKVFGIGPTLEKLLNQNGIYLFRQIAEWSPDDVQRYDGLLEQFRGRIERENWIASAKEQHFKKYGEQL